MKRKTPLKRTRPMARSRLKKKPAPHGFPDHVRVAVRRRSDGACEVESKVCDGTAQHFHHRKLRRHKDHTEINCLHVCSACHTHIHNNTGKAYLMGWLVHSWATVSEIPVKRGRNYGD